MTKTPKEDSEKKTRAVKKEAVKAAPKDRPEVVKASKAVPQVKEAKRVETPVEVGSSEAKPKKSKQPSLKARLPLAPRTFAAKWDEVPARWRLVDATGQALGRLSSQIAHVLMGKDKATYTRSTDTGDFVVVINAGKVKLTGNKLQDKVYQHHTGYPGGLKSVAASDLMTKNPEKLVEFAVFRMLPKGHMGRRWFKKLKVYPGQEHPHAAQNPQPVNWEVSRTEGN